MKQLNTIPHNAPEQNYEVAPPYWYVLKTKPHSEDMATNILRQQGIKVYLPTLLTRNNHRRALKASPLFPGYLFFWLEQDSRLWSYVKWAGGISYVLSGSHGPLYVPSQLIDHLKQGEKIHIQQMQENISRPFETGEALQIIDGPFKGLEVVFERRLSAGGRCQVLLEILGRLTSLKVEETNLVRAVL